MQPPYKKPKTKPLVGLARDLGMKPMELVAEGVNESLEVCVALAGLEAERVELDDLPVPGWVGGGRELDGIPDVLRIAPRDLRQLLTRSSTTVEMLLDLREVPGRENPPHLCRGWSYAWRVIEPLEVTVFGLLVRTKEWKVWKGRRGKPGRGNRTVESPTVAPMVVQIEHVVVQGEPDVARPDEQADVYGLPGPAGQRDHDEDASAAAATPAAETQPSPSVEPGGPGADTKAAAQPDGEEEPAPGERQPSESKGMYEQRVKRQAVLLSVAVDWLAELLDKDLKPGEAGHRTSDGVVVRDRMVEELIWRLLDLIAPGGDLSECRPKKAEGYGRTSVDKALEYAGVVADVDWSFVLRTLLSDLAAADERRSDVQQKLAEKAEAEAMERATADRKARKR